MGSTLGQDWARIGLGLGQDWARIGPERREIWLTLYWENGRDRSYFLTHGKASVVEGYADRFPRSHRNNGNGLVGYSSWPTLDEAVADGQAWLVGFCSVARHAEQRRASKSAGVR